MSFAEADFPSQFEFFFVLGIGRISKRETGAFEEEAVEVEGAGHYQIDYLRRLLVDLEKVLKFKLQQKWLLK